MKFFLKFFFFILLIKLSTSQPKFIKKCVEFEPSKHEKIGESFTGKWYILKFYIDPVPPSDYHPQCLSVIASPTEESNKIMIDTVVLMHDKTASNWSIAATVEKPGVFLVETDHIKEKVNLNY